MPNLIYTVLTLTPSSSLISSPQSGHCGDVPVVALDISSSAQRLQTRCPQPSWTGSCKRRLHHTQLYRWRFSTSLKIFCGTLTVPSTSIENDAFYVSCSASNQSDSPCADCFNLYIGTEFWWRNRAREICPWEIPYALLSISTYFSRCVDGYARF